MLVGQVLLMSADNNSVSVQYVACNKQVDRKL